MEQEEILELRYCPSCKSGEVTQDEIPLDNKNVDDASVWLEYYKCQACAHEWADLEDVQISPISLTGYLMNQIMEIIQQ